MLGIFNCLNKERKTNECKHSSREEQQYLDLIKDTINNGSIEESRNGKTYTKFGNMMKFSLKNGKMPILTTKQVAWRVCFEELFWFIKGSTNNTELKEKKVNIWNDNSSREFLDSRGLYNLEENDLGPVYGHQWRHFNAEYIDCDTDYNGNGVDQLQYIIDQLKNPETRNSRRLVMSAWNPCQINQMALPPCHMICQFHVREGKYLSCALFQRSGDIGLGIPFNITSYSLLTHILAKHCGLEADEFVHFLGNCHIYEDHLMALKIQIERSPFDFPEIEICNKHANIEDYNISDIKWVNPYLSHSSIKMKMQA
jgi:thymidylate synthase